MDSNHGMGASKAPALPLGDSPTCFYFSKIFEATHGAFPSHQKHILNPLHKGVVFFLTLLLLMKTSSLIGGTALAAAIVAGAIFSLQNFDAEAVACKDIAEARASLQATYDAGVNASVQVFAEERADAEEALSRCISAKPVDPCEDAQKTRDAAVANFNGITSPADSAPYAEFQMYFAKRDEAYNAYKKAKDALDQCRAANPPKGDVPYEESDTKACFDAYDASMASTQATFTTNTQALRSAFNAATAALDAREKACNPPTGDGQFTELGGGDGAEDDSEDGSTPIDIQNCQPVDPNWDSEIMALRARAAAIPVEIKAIEDGIENIRKRMSPLQRDLADVDTYIPPESAKTQFEGALNAKRAERKVSIELSLEFYNNLLARREAEKAKLEQELSDVQAKIAARLAQIEQENAERQRKYPTNIHQSRPDKCEYYHCHGVLCGRPDPVTDGCGHGSTTPDDVDCSQFMKAYLKAAGVR